MSRKDVKTMHLGRKRQGSRQGNGHPAAAFFGILENPSIGVYLAPPVFAAWPIARDSCPGTGALNAESALRRFLIHVCTRRESNPKPPDP